MRLRQLRALVTEAIEPLRKDKVIGSSLQAALRIRGGIDGLHIDAAALQELAISAGVALMPGGETIEVEVAASDDPRCERCWRYLPDVAEETGLCGRCASVLAYA